MSRNPVVVGVKEQQPTALRFAAEAALARGVDLHLIHCIEPLVSGDILLPVDEPAQTEGRAILEDARALIDFLETAPAVTSELSIGSPVGVLSDAAEKASLVVVGTDEADWGVRLLTDKVTERLAKHAPVPVAVIPEWSRTHHVGRGVYVAIDGRSPAAGPLRYAFSEASRQHPMRLHVLHAPPASTLPHEMDEVRAELSEILAGWGEEFPDVDVTYQLVFDETDRGCVNATQDAGVFVLGRATRNGVSSIFGHPVITEIVRHTHCPSVVVPNDWAEE